MTVANALANISSTGLPVAWRARPRVEKTRFSNGLDGERHDAQQQPAAFARPVVHAKPSQFETVQMSRDWTAPVLVPSFVAQLMGQMLAGSSADMRSAMSAYRGGETAGALLLDRQA